MFQPDAKIKIIPPQCPFYCKYGTYCQDGQCVVSSFFFWHNECLTKKLFLKHIPVNIPKVAKGKGSPKIEVIPAPRQEVSVEYPNIDSKSPLTRKHSLVYPSVFASMWLKCCSTGRKKNWENVKFLT